MALVIILRSYVIYSCFSALSTHRPVCVLSGAVSGIDASLDSIGWFSRRKFAPSCWLAKRGRETGGGKIRRRTSRRNS
jgi:hypothetical protein